MPKPNLKKGQPKPQQTTVAADSKDRGDDFQEIDGRLFVLGLVSLATSQVREEWIPFEAASPYLLAVLMAFPAGLLSYWVWRSTQILRCIIEESSQLNPTYRIRRDRLRRSVFISCGLIANSCLMLFLQLSHQGLHGGFSSLLLSMILILAAASTLAWIWTLRRSEHR